MFKWLAIFIVLLLPTTNKSGQRQNSSALLKDNGDSQRTPTVSFVNNETCYPQTGAAKADPPNWYTLPEWWLFILGIPTLVFLGWQARETRRAAEATQTSAAVIKTQTAILQASVDASEKNADAARDAAMTARINTDALINSERAWILVEIGWYDGTPIRMAEETSHRREGVPSEITTANVKLTCRNEGRSPAWIDHVYARMAIESPLSAGEDYDRRECNDYGPMAPIGAGMEKSRSLYLVCDRRMEEGEEFFAVYVIVDYYDIFGLPRETTIGYQLHWPGELGLPNRNSNT